MLMWSGDVPKFAFIFVLSPAPIALGNFCILLIFLGITIVPSLIPFKTKSVDTCSYFATSSTSFVTIFFCAYSIKVITIPFQKI